MSSSVAQLVLSWDLKKYTNYYNAGLEYQILWKDVQVPLSPIIQDVLCHLEKYVFQKSQYGLTHFMSKFDPLTLSIQPFKTEVLIGPQPDQEGNKLQQQTILMFIYPIYNHNSRNISTMYIYNKTSIKRNILTIKQNTSGSRSG